VEVLVRRLNRNPAQDRYNVEKKEVVVLIVGERLATNCLLKERSFMAIKTIPLSLLATDLAKTLNECAESGQTVVVEMPDQRLLAIHPLDPHEDDSLIDELLASNPKFQALVAKSKTGPRKPFSLEDPGQTHG
jgi:hypothetical protein